MTTTTSDRRGELLDIAAGLFADRGLKATTVRDIADAAGILSGSLYHHFDSKEAMVDEILRSFLDELFGAYEAILAHELTPRERLEAIVVASFEALERRHASVAIYQNEARHLADQPRFGYIRERLDEFRTLWKDLLRDGMKDGSFRKDLDVELAYRFFRDTVWVGVRWYRPGGPLTIHDVTKQYLSIVLDGIGSRP
ncbi:MAG: TetR/AcrR family transcriptional regulator, cholesterol catabolism regulator [Pseudonocardiales bacterium]|jgi:AcrR family transcriptional regulator|nr:TetR/AcrR family transcriptional regulator, cholesterol catabolism regulator [Pseudonocardiales bacterium]